MLAGLPVTEYTAGQVKQAVVGGGRAQKSQVQHMVCRLLSLLADRTRAAFCLALIPPLMLGLGWDPNYAEVARGIIIIVVVMIGGLVQVPRRSR